MKTGYINSTHVAVYLNYVDFLFQSPSKVHIQMAALNPPDASAPFTGHCED